jgi:hypothetical protein
MKNSFVFLSVCLCLLFNAPAFGKEEYHWPPKDGEHVITLLGPIYEAGRETKVPLFKALEQAMTAIVENQQTHLPEFYQQRIAGMNHQLFRPGYSNDEEWGSIKSLSSKAEDYDSERIAGILESSEYRKPGLEMAIRMQPLSNQNPDSVILEGYRFVLQPSGKGQAEWFTEEVRMKGREAGDAFRKALVWLLAKPFTQAQKSFVLESEKVPLWKGKNTAGTLEFADKKFTADAEPIRKETAKACVQTRFCPEIKMEGDEFVLVSNFTDAQTICRKFGRELIDKDTLLRLSMIEEGSNLLDKENGAAWHSGEEMGYFKEHYGHKEFIQAETGAVWCRLAKQETSPIFTEHPANYLIDRTGLSLSVYQSVYISGTDRTDKYWRFGKSMVVSKRDQDSEKAKIQKFWILDNALAQDVQEKTVIDISTLPRQSSIYVERNTMDFVFQCRPEVTCDSFEQSVPVNRIGYFFSGGFFGPSYGFGFIQNNVDYGKYNDKAKFGTVALLNLYIDTKFELPLELLPGFRWSLLGRLDWINLTQTVSNTPDGDSGKEKKASASILQLIAGAKLSYMLGPVELFGGAMANTGGSEDYSKSGVNSDVYESSGTTYYKVYFEKVTIKSGVAPLIGVAFKW